jgi:hypothetical protein
MAPWTGAVGFVFSLFNAVAAARASCCSVQPLHQMSVSRAEAPSDARERAKAVASSTECFFNAHLLEKPTGREAMACTSHSVASTRGMRRAGQIYMLGGTA